MNKTSPSPENAGRMQAGRFRKGVSGNPKGKPAGLRNHVSRIVEQLLEGEAEAITRKAIEAALAGDMAAIRLVMDRLAPPRRDRPVSVDLPAITSAADAESVCLALLRATIAGELTPEESLKLAGVVEVWRKASETAQVEQRMEALEERLAALNAHEGASIAPHAYGRRVPVG